MSIPALEISGGLKPTVIGLGTMGLGGRYERDESDDESAIRLIRFAYASGVNFFDTAEVYGAGHGEEVLGAAVSTFRKDVIIATKFSSENSRYNDVVAACEASLKRLETDYIDLYQTHWPNPSVPFEETLQAMESLVTAGKVRCLGFSNATTAIARRAQAFLSPKTPIAAMQQEYSLVERFVETKHLPFCRDNNMALIAYSPLAQGRLTQEENLVLHEIARDNGLTLSQAALQWVVNQLPALAIPMSSKHANLEENLRSLERLMPASDLQRLSDEYRVEIREIPVERIRVVNSHTGKMFRTLEEAKRNTLNMSPSPSDVAAELHDGEMLKPIKVRQTDSETDSFDLFEGQLRYWAWCIAHEGRLPIPAQVVS